jgi:hypothetical protein
MAYKLAIANEFGLRVEGKTRDGAGADKPFSFVLTCDRLSGDELQQSIKDNAETIQQFFERVAKGWKDQRLVLDEEGKPAEFCVDALRVLMSINAMPQLCWQAYLTQVGAAAKNS